MPNVYSYLHISGTAEQFSTFVGGGGGLTSDFNWGKGAEETLLLVNLYFFRNIGHLGLSGSAVPVFISAV